MHIYARGALYYLCVRRSKVGRGGQNLGTEQIEREKNAKPEK